MKNFEKSIFLGDMHVPFVDKNSLKVSISFMDWFKPDDIYLIGDIMDWYELSTFDKDPLRINDLQKDIDKTVSILKLIRERNDKAKITYLEGNHEHRLTKWLMRHPEVSSLKALDITNLLNLKELDIEYKDQFQTVKLHEFLIEHGSVVRQQSAYTARAMLEKRGISGISGHTHRMGAHYLTNMSGSYAWFENGCLCDLHPEYVVGQPNWMQGVSVGYFKKTTDRFNIMQLPTVDKHLSFCEMEF